MLKVSLRAIGQEYFHVRPLSSEIIRCTSVCFELVDVLEATAQYNRPWRPSQMAPRLYAGMGSPWRFLAVSPRQGAGMMASLQVRPPFSERTMKPPRKT